MFPRLLRLLLLGFPRGHKYFHRGRIELPYLAVRTRLHHREIIEPIHEGVDRDNRNHKQLGKFPLIHHGNPVRGQRA